MTRRRQWHVVLFLASLDFGGLTDKSRGRYHDRNDDGVLGALWGCVDRGGSVVSSAEVVA